VQQRVVQFHGSSPLFAKIDEMDEFSGVAVVVVVGVIIDIEPPIMAPAPASLPPLPSALDSLPRPAALRRS
jgi:hypothetical protein